MRNYFNKALAGMLLASFINFTFAPAYADTTILGGGSTGGVITDLGGAKVIENTANSAQIGITGNGNVIKWDSLNVGTGKQLDYNFAQAGQVALNKVLGGSMSVIAGQISTSGADGRLIISNPAGMLFADGAVVNANSLILTTKDVNWDGQLNGRLELKDYIDNGLTSAIAINAATFNINDDLNIVAPNVSIDGADIMAGKDVRIYTTDGVNFLKASRDVEASVDSNNWLNTGKIDIDNAQITVKDNTTGKIYIASRGDIDVKNSKIQGNLVAEAKERTILQNKTVVNGDVTTTTKEVKAEDDRNFLKVVLDLIFDGEATPSVVEKAVYKTITTSKWDTTTTYDLLTSRGDIVISSLDKASANYNMTLTGGNITVTDVMANNLVTSAISNAVKTTLTKVDNNENIVTLVCDVHDFVVTERTPLLKIPTKGEFDFSNATKSTETNVTAQAPVETTTPVSGKGNVKFTNVKAAAADITGDNVTTTDSDLTGGTGSGTGSEVAGGEEGTGSGSGSEVAGGEEGTGSGTGSEVAGGEEGTGSGSGSEVAGGEEGTGSGSGSEVAGGEEGTGSGTGSEVAGGEEGTGSGSGSEVAGGEEGTGSGSGSEVAGGSEGTGSGSGSEVAGGSEGTGSGSGSEIAGGSEGTGSGSGSLISSEIGSESVLSETIAYETSNNEYTAVNRKKFGSELDTSLNRQFNVKGFAASDDEIKERMNNVNSSLKRGINNSIITTTRFIAD